MSDPEATRGAEKTPASGGDARPRVVRVLCVEDLHPIAEAICDAVNDAGDMQSVGVLASPEGLVEEVRQRKPDIVLLDLYYGGRDAFAQLIALVSAEPAVRVIVVSGDNHPHTIMRAFDLGAHGYVVKSDMREVIDAIRAVAAGRDWRPGESSAPENDSTDALIDAMVEALGDPVSVEGSAWAWQLGRLRIEAHVNGESVVIYVPWPLESVADPPSFADLHEEKDGDIKLRFAVRSRPSLDLVLGVIAYEVRGG